MGVLNHDATRDPTKAENLVRRYKHYTSQCLTKLSDQIPDQSQGAHHADGHPQRLRAGGVPRGHGTQVRSQHLELPRAGYNNNSKELPSSTPDFAQVYYPINTYSYNEMASFVGDIKRVVGPAPALADNGNSYIMEVI